VLLAHIVFAEDPERLAGYHNTYRYFDSKLHARGLLHTDDTTTAVAVSADVLRAVPG